MTVMPVIVDIKTGTLLQCPFLQHDGAMMTGWSKRLGISCILLEQRHPIKWQLFLFLQDVGINQVCRQNSVFIAVMGSQAPLSKRPLWTSDVVRLTPCIGATGSGKSSLIKAVSDRDDIRIGHDLSSCKLRLISSYERETSRKAVRTKLFSMKGTSSVAIFHFELEEYNVCLVDTPGFDVEPPTPVHLLCMIF